MSAVTPSAPLEGPIPLGSAPAATRARLPLGPLETVHVFWLAGMSCDGCTIAVSGSTNPRLEGLLTDTVDGEFSPLD